MRTHELITLRRDCAAIVIPDGYQVTLPAGSDVILTQSLGGDYTVMTTQGYLARISGKDADAIGEQGKVISRAEVPFDAPAAMAAAAPAPPAPAPKALSPAPTPPADQTGASPAPGSQTAAASAPPSGSSPSPVAQAPPAATSTAPADRRTGQSGTSVASNDPAANPVVSEVSAVTVTRGDSLWRISRLRLGNGMRYTVIYEANSSQIRNPNLIYSGQVLVLPRK